jgi:hypothetical protein
MCSRVGHSLHLLDGTPCRHNGPRFRVCLFLHGFWPPTPRTAGRGNCVPRPRPLCPGGRPLAFSSPLRTFSMDAAKGNPLLGGALGFPPVSAGSSCRAFVRSLARAFRLAGHSSGPWRAPSSERQRPPLPGVPRRDVQTTLRTAFLSPGWHGGWTRSRGRLGRLSPRWNAGPPKTKNGCAFAWARFLMGLGKRSRERRSRHLGVVGMVVGCAPGGGLVGHPPDEMPPPP